MSARSLQETSVRYFLEVVRSGSITEAAERLNVVPSAISKQIARLESQLNTQLFERRARGMVPSAAGELLAAYAFRSQLEAERVNNEITELLGMRRGEVRIAATEGFSVDFLPRTIIEFRQRNPGISFQLEISQAPEIVRKLKEAEVDLGLTFSQEPELGLEVLTRASLPTMVIVHRDHPLATSGSLKLGQLVGQPVGMPARQIMMRRMVETSCAKHGLELNVVFSTNSIASLSAFAKYEGGLVIAVACLLKRHLQDNELIAIPLKERSLEPLNVELQALSRRILPKPVLAFVELLRTELAHIQ